MKINKLHPWLPQETPKPLSYHPKIDSDIKQATRRLERIKNEFTVVRKKYVALRKKQRGPATVERIAIFARYQRSRIELREAKLKLRRLLAMKSRKK